MYSCCRFDPVENNASQGCTENGNKNKKQKPKKDSIETRSEKSFQKESLSQYTENSEVMAMDGIDIQNIDGFIDYLKDSYGGIDTITAQEMNDFNWRDTAWKKDKVFEGRLEDNGMFNYSIIIFSKQDDCTINCKYALHRLDLRKNIEIYSQSGYLSRLGNFFTSWKLKSSHESGLSKSTIKELQHFFRYKAYKALYDQGNIEEIPIERPSTMKIEDILTNSSVSQHSNQPSLDDAAEPELGNENLDSGSGKSTSHVNQNENKI